MIAPPDPQLPVFVYGTLRPGASNEHVLVELAIATWPALLPRHDLYALEYPCVLPGEGDVVGDLVWLDPSGYGDAVARLDWFEGYQPGDADGSLYVRGPCSVQADYGSADGPQGVAAWLYVPGPQLRDRLAGMAPIAGGDWLAEEEHR